MQKVEVERNLSPEEEKFEAAYRKIKLKLAKPGSPHFVRIASDQEGLMHLDIESTGQWGIKMVGEDGNDTYDEYGRVDLTTAEQLYAFVKSPEFRIIETATPNGESYKEAMEAHMFEYGSAYQQGLLGAMDALAQPS